MARYDAAVIGAGLGGLAAAALLSSRKKKTVVLESGESLNSALGLLEKDGFAFFSTPDLLYGLERGGDIHEFFASLGIVQSASVDSPCYQVALPDKRITVYAEQDETLEELRREFPEEIDRVANFYRDLHKKAIQNANNRFFSSLSRHRTAAGFIRRYRFSRELTAFFDIQSLYFFQRPAGDLSLSSLIALCDFPPLHLHGGFKKYADQLYSIILQQGGEVRYHESPPALAPGSGKVAGIKTAQEEIEAETVLLNCGPPHAPTTLFAGLHEEVVPVGMGREVLFLPDYALPHDFIALSLSVKDDTSAAPSGARSLRASFFSNRSRQNDTHALVERTSELIPFLSEHLLFAEQYSRSAGYAVPPADITLKPLHGRSLLSRTPFKNVYALTDAPEAPLEVITAVRRFIAGLK